MLLFAAPLVARHQIMQRGASGGLLRRSLMNGNCCSTNHQYGRVIATNSTASLFSSTTSLSSSSSGNNDDATYYDSQSGMHIAHHDETKVSLYWSSGGGVDDDGNNKLLSTAIDLGVSGALVLQSPSNNIPETPPPPEFTLCTPYNDDNDETVDANRQLLFEYRIDDDAWNATMKEALSKHHNSNSTAIGLFQNEIYQEHDPILVAAEMGTLLDSMDAAAAANSLWLVPNEKLKDDDNMVLVSLCQELAYLDLTGPTMKSRLIVQASSQDQVEECLMMGISKFVIGAANDVDWIRTVVEEERKELVLRSATTTSS